LLRDAIEKAGQLLWEWLISHFREHLDVQHILFMPQGGIGFVAIACGMEQG